VISYQLYPNILTPSGSLSAVPERLLRETFQGAGGWAVCATGIYYEPRRMAREKAEKFVDAAGGYRDARGTSAG
jgi:hypothetical protein